MKCFFFYLKTDNKILVSYIRFVISINYVESHDTFWCQKLFPYIYKYKEVNVLIRIKSSVNNWDLFVKHIYPQVHKRHNLNALHVHSPPHPPHHQWNMCMCDVWYDALEILGWTYSPNLVSININIRQNSKCPTCWPRPHSMHILVGSFLFYRLLFQYSPCES